MCVPANSGQLCVIMCVCGVCVCVCVCVCARARAQTVVHSVIMCIMCISPTIIPSCSRATSQKQNKYTPKTPQLISSQKKKKKKILKNVPKKGQKEQQEQVTELERREVESTEIPDRRKTSEISGLPSWRRSRMTCSITHQADKETETDKADLLLGRRRGRCRHHAASCDVSCVCVSPTAPCRGVGASACPRRTPWVATSRRLSVNSDTPPPFY